MSGKPCRNRIVIPDLSTPSLTQSAKSNKPTPIRKTALAIPTPTSK